MATIAMEVLAGNQEEAKDLVYYDALKRVTETCKDENKNAASHKKNSFANLVRRTKSSRESPSIPSETADSKTVDSGQQKENATSNDVILTTIAHVQPLYLIWRLWFISIWQSVVARLKDFILDPEGDAYYSWAGMVTCAVIYNYWIILMRIAFTEISVEPGYRVVYYPLDLLSDVIYLVDIGMQFRTAYRDDHGIMVSAPTRMATTYCSKPSFRLDVLAISPLQTVLPLLFGVQPSIFYRCPRLLKWNCVLKFFVVSDLRTNKPNRLRVFKLTLYLGIAIHWVACGYYMLSEYEGLGSNTWVYPAPKGEDRELLRKYIKSLYWSILTLTTIGETPDPCTNIEHVFTSLMFLLGIFVFAAVVGNVGDVISNMNAARANFQTKMDYIKSYMEHHKVPVDLQNRAKRWAYYAWSRSHSLDEGDSLDMLPLRLRAELAIHVHLATLKKVKIFKDCDEGLLCELVLKLRPQIFSPNDFICRCGEIGREMYIINHGKVEVVVPDATTGEEVVVASLSEGNYFGEISLLKLDGGRNRRSADVRSVGYSELLCLSQMDLMEALKEYPDAKKVLESQGRDRLQRTKSEGNMLVPRRLVERVEGKQELHINLAREINEIRTSIEEMKTSNDQCSFLRQEAEILRRQLREAQERISDLESDRSAVSSSKQCASSSAVVSSLVPHNRIPPGSNKQFITGKTTSSRTSPAKRRKTSADRLLKSLLRAAKAASEKNTPHAHAPQPRSSLLVQRANRKTVTSSEEELSTINTEERVGCSENNNGHHSWNASSSENNKEHHSENASSENNIGRHSGGNLSPAKVCSLGVKAKKRTRRVCFTPEITVYNDIDGKLRLQPPRRYSLPS